MTYLIVFYTDYDGSIKLGRIPVAPKAKRKGLIGRAIRRGLGGGGS